MTYEVQQTRWDRIIRRVSGSIGPGSRVSETLSELFPVLDVERVPGELLLLGGTIPGIASGRASSAATQFNAVQLFNPPDSGVIVTVTRIDVSTQTTQAIVMEFDSAQIGSLITNAPRSRDLRVLFPTQPVARLSISTGLVAPIGGIGQFRVDVQDHLVISDENGVVIMPPGNGVSIGGVVAQTVLFVNYLWRERPAEQAELQF
ncbi:hypothetical protein LCGC14_2994590 [marine sediment metagenome]|uniref:Uncharacterized protein n=1 Tax=marine sediment metagenome TaxID=412755 RepID=A0A0F8X3B7_9ZZZZ